MIFLRSSDWPVEIVRHGDRETALCTVRLEGREYDGIHYSDLCSSKGGQDLALAFYGPSASIATRRDQVRRRSSR